jgi:hypothetical protein
MAVIATYLSDDFLTLYNYIRASAIKQAFKNISEILDKFLRRAGDKQSTVNLGRDWEFEESQVPVAIEEMKRILIVIVASSYRKAG